MTAELLMVGAPEGAIAVVTKPLTETVPETGNGLDALAGTACPELFR
jgi:hypothetical protein